MSDPVSVFVEHMARHEAPAVLELGALQSTPGQSTLHRAWVPHAAIYLGSDLQAGRDVDVVADVHKLSSVIKDRFEAIITCSGFEHFKYPQIAAHEIMKTLKLGGLVFVQTHQTFPLHAYPHDYCRFSKDALVALFNEVMGMETLAVSHDFPASIRAERVPGMERQRAFLNSVYVGVKREKTPATYKPDLRVL